MLRSSLRVAVLGLVLATVAGCDTEPVPSIGGRYSAVLPNDLEIQGLPVGLLLTLQAQIPHTEAGPFTFGGTLSSLIGGGTLSFAFSGTGTYDHPDVAARVTLTAPVAQTIDLSGVASEDGGTITLSNDEGIFITLVRTRR